MTGVALVLTCLAILIQFYGVLSENDSIDNGVIKTHRLKRSHASPVNDVILNSTNYIKPGKEDVKKSKIDNSIKRRGKTSPKRKHKIVKDELKPTDEKNNNIKVAEKFIGPKNREHFIEDIDDNWHIQVKEPRLEEKPVKTERANETSKITKLPKKDKIESMNKSVLPENTTQKSPNELISQLKTAVDPEKNDKPTVMLPSDLNGYSKGNLENATKEHAKDESIASIRKSPNNESDDQKPGSENGIIEIKEHKYEEEIVRFYPTKQCQPNVRRYWDASQNFNPRFSSPYARAMNPYQGQTRTDPYQRIIPNKDKYYSAYTCSNYKDPNNGRFFYANFDRPYNSVEENRRFQGYGNYDTIRKTWRDINTKIRRPRRPDECVDNITKDYIGNQE